MKAAKLQKRDDKTKDLVAKRIQTTGLVNGRWTVLPRNYKFPNGMTMMHLIDSWLLWATEDTSFCDIASKQSNRTATKGASENEGNYDAREKAWSERGILGW